MLEGLVWALSWFLHRVLSPWPIRGQDPDAPRDLDMVVAVRKWQSRHANR